MITKQAQDLKLPFTQWLDFVNEKIVISFTIDYNIIKNNDSKQDNFLTFKGWKRFIDYCKYKNKQDQSIYFSEGTKLDKEQEDILSTTNDEVEKKLRRLKSLSPSRFLFTKVKGGG